MNEKTELLKLNEQTFEAEVKNDIEGKKWDQFLRDILADEFIIRRSNPAIPNQNKQQMIDWIADPNRPTPKRTLGQAETWYSGSIGIVTCPVTITGENAKVRRYQNIKVFEKPTDRRWQLVYWQVSEMPV